MSEMRSSTRPSSRPKLPKRRPVTDSVATPHRIFMGLAPLAADECWLELDEELGTFLATKKILLAEQREQVFVELPESRPGQRAIFDLVVQTLLECHPAQFERQGQQLCILETGSTIDLADDATPPLIRGALCVQEDLVLMLYVVEGFRT